MASVINVVRLHNVICFALKDAAFLNARICCQREIYRKYFSGIHRRPVLCVGYCSVVLICS